MGTINLDPSTHENLRLIAAALGLTESATVAELIQRLARTVPSANGHAVPIHVIYKGERVDALFDSSTESVQIVSGSLSGKTFPKPSPAAMAVIEAIDPSVSPNRNGWGTWAVTATGKPLQSIRRS